MSKVSTGGATVVPSSAIGISQFLVALNGTYNVYSRANLVTLLGSTSNTSFWSNIGGSDAAGLCATDPQGQPSVAYDWQADRFVVTEAAYALDSSNQPVAPYVQCVAVSTTGDATGVWNRYVFQISTTVYPDHPSLGVWADGYYLSFNQHTSTGTWAGAGALALERSQMLQGNAAQARYFDLGNVTPGLGGMLPATITGPNQPTAAAPELYLQAHDDPLNINDRLEVWGFHVDWSAPVTGSTFQPITNLPLPSPVDTGFSCLEPNTASTFWDECLLQLQPPNGVANEQLQPLSQAFSSASDALPQLGGQLQWGRSAGGNETLTATATVNVGSNVSDPAWFKLANIGGAGWTINAHGVFNPGDGVQRFLPSTGFDNSGDVALAYEETNSLIDPSTAYTEATNGSFGDQVMDAGTVPWASSPAFGKYTTLSLDPVDMCTFWFTGASPDVDSHGVQEFALDDFVFPGCVASATQPPLLTGNPSWTAPLVREGLTINGNAATFTGQTGTSFQWQRCDTQGWNCVDIPGATASSYAMTATDAAGDHTLRFEEYATNANPGTTSAVSTATTLVQSIPPVNTVQPLISGTAQAGSTLSTDNGTWTSSSPLSYTYRWRRCASGTCTNIPGATASTYTLTSSDVGDTVDVIVSATNTGGGTDANAVATSAVTAAPAGGSGGTSGAGTSGGGTSGGGGGGTGGTLDLTVTGSVYPANPPAGSNVTYQIAGVDLVNQLAQNVHVIVTLPTGVTVLSTYADRGPGCKATSTLTLDCNLDFLSGEAPRGNIQITATVGQAGAEQVTAAISAQQSESSLANNTATIKYTVGTTTTTTTTTTPTTTGGVPGGLNATGTSANTPDKKAPTARALGSAALPGTMAKLKFRISDNRGTAKALVTVKHGARIVGTAKTGFGPVVAGSTYFVGWHVPKTLRKGEYSFCVVAVDKAGNRSHSTCAALAVK